MHRQRRHALINVLFVCLGNICRSPMADGVFQNMVAEAGLSAQIHVDSAGTAGYHVGETAHSGTLKTLKKHGINYTSRSRQLHHQDFDKFDYILAMDEDNLASIRSSLASNNQATVRLFLDYADGQKTREVPDPYYNGRFDEVYDLVLAGSKGLLEAIRKEYNL